HQWAGGVEHRQIACGGLFFHAPCNAVGAEYGDGPWRNLGQILDENRALVLQALDDVLIVNDLVADVHRGAVFLQSSLDDLDRADNARAESARLRQEDFNRASVSQFAPYALYCNSI